MSRHIAKPAAAASEPLQYRRMVVAISTGLVRSLAEQRCAVLPFKKGQEVLLLVIG